MPSREGYEQNDGQAAVGAHSLLSMIGQSKHLTAGWAGFAVKTVTVSASAGTVFGLSAYMLLHGPLGPALSFMCGSGFGFLGGLVSRWRTDVAEALHATSLYPRIMEHHVRLGAPGCALRGQDWEHWVRDAGRSLQKQSVLVAALYSAAPALDRIRQEREEALVAAYAAGAVAAVEGYGAGGS